MLGLLRRRCHGPLPQRARPLGRAGLAGAVLLLGCATGCSCELSRDACLRDGDCADDQVCYYDQRCVGRSAARHQGAEVGNECRAAGGEEIGCPAPYPCRLGACDREPEFDGASVAVSDGPTAVVVRWSHADDETPRDRIAYHVFVATSPGAHDFSTPTTSVSGETEARVTGLQAWLPYTFVVRAEDEYGQADNNVQEVSATPGCVSFETQVQPTLERQCVPCHGDEAPGRGLRLASPDDILPGAGPRSPVVPCHPGSSLLYLTSSLSERHVDWEEPPLEEDQLDALETWIEQGAVLDCDVAQSLCADRVPPSFGGIAMAQAIDGAIEVCWSSAEDDVSPPEALVYGVFWSADRTGPGRMPRRTTAPGERCTLVEGLIPERDYCLAVRARDEAGNWDANSETLCVTTPSQACIDYESVIQPLLDERCSQCHGGRNPPRELGLTSYEELSAGAIRGAVLTPCDPASSLLLQKVSPEAGDGHLTPLEEGLDAAELAALSAWIEEGARPACAQGEGPEDEVCP